MNKEILKNIKLNDFNINDDFWSEKMELIRKEVIPYQWNLLNDNVEDAAPSFCIRNFKIAGNLMKKKLELGNSFVEPTYTFRGFETLPKDMNHLEDEFYGFVFQDSDLYKWIEACAYTLINHPDEELEKLADSAIDLICTAKAENGYLDTYYIINGMDKIFTNLRDHHELYCFGHLTEAAVAYFHATGKEKLLKVAMEMADFIDDYFGPEKNKCHGYPGHEICEMALCKLYEATGKKRYLNLSKYFIDTRGGKPNYYDTENHNDNYDYKYNQSHKPVREQTEAVGHAVRATYLYSGMADIARLTHDTELFNTLEKLWDSVTTEKMYITGGIGATRNGEAFSTPYNLPSDSAYAETCASIGLIFWANRMLKIDTHNRYADTLELALFNTVLSGISLDGKGFFYTNPLSVRPDNVKNDEALSHIKTTRPSWFSCACCPPNLARLISSLPSYAYSTNSNTLFAHLFISGTINTTINNKSVCFNVSSNYPEDGKIRFTYQGVTNDIKLAVRIPGWCTSYNIDSHGKSVEINKGYAYISGVFNDKDIIDIDFDINIRLVKSNEKVLCNQGKVALMRGPVVYCLESIDNGENLDDIRIDPDSFATSVTTKNITIKNNKVLGIDVSGLRLIRKNEDNLYSSYKPDEYTDTTLSFIPYYTWANRGENEMDVWIKR